MLDWLKAQIYYEIIKQFQYLDKVAELRTKIKNSPKPQFKLPKSANLQVFC